MYINFLAWETTAVRIVVLYRMSSCSRVYNHCHKIRCFILSLQQTAKSLGEQAELGLYC